MKLSRWELGWARAALETIFPGSEEQGLVGVGSMDVEGYFQDLVSGVPLRPAIGLRVALWLVALSPLLLLRRVALFPRLAPALREELMTRLITHPSYPVRSLAMALKAVGAMLYAGAPAVRARMQRAVPPPAESLVQLRASASRAA